MTMLYAKRFAQQALVAAALLLGSSGLNAASVYKVLGQLNPTATTLTTLYTVPGSTSTIVSQIVVTNQAAVNATFRLSVQPACAAVDPKHYIAYDMVAPANDAVIVPSGFTLATTDCVRIYASTSTMSFNIFGVEIQ